jgi:hypothetical protein
LACLSFSRLVGSGHGAQTKQASFWIAPRQTWKRQLRATRTRSSSLWTK